MANLNYKTLQCISKTKLNSSTLGNPPNVTVWRFFWSCRQAGLMHLKRLGKAIVSQSN